MAKVTVAFLTLILLGSWGYVAWGEYRAMMAGPDDSDGTVARELSPIGFAEYVLGTNGEYNDRQGVQPGMPEARTSVQIALGAAVAMSATMLFAVTGGSGAIFSMMVTAFIGFFTATATMVFVISLLSRLAMALYPGEEAIEYSLPVYGLGLFSALCIVTCFTLMRQLSQLVRGKRSGMLAAAKCLLVLMVACASLAPLGVPTEFVVFGYHGLYALAALCLFSLLLVGATRGNYQYD